MEWDHPLLDSPLPSPLPLPPVITGPVKINTNLDYYGANIVEIAFNLNTNGGEIKVNAKPYPTKFIGGGLNINPPSDSGVVYFLFSCLNFEHVLLGACHNPSCLFEQIDRIYKSDVVDTNQLSDQDFFINVVKYISLRFVLSGILFEEFSEKWLKEQYYDSFITKLAFDPNLKVYLPLFTDPEYGFVDYFKLFVC